MYFLSRIWPLYLYKTIFKKKNKRKTHSKSRDIIKINILPRLGKRFSIFRWLVAKWRCKVFVCNVIGNMVGSSNKGWRHRRFEPSHEMGVKKAIKWNISLELISLWYASMDRTATAILSCISPLVLHLQRVQEQWLCKMLNHWTSHLLSVTLGGCENFRSEN